MRNLVASRNARVREKWQITIPAEIRECYDLHVGDVISFEIRPEGILLQRNQDIVRRTAGIFAAYAKNGPTEIDRDAIWSEIAAEKEERYQRQLADEQRQIAEESAKYDPS